MENENTIEINKHSEGIVKEGSATLVAGGNVFYNPVQEFNRDLSTLVLQLYFNYLNKERCDKNKNIDEKKEYICGTKYDDGLKILEALSATGLRSIRYAKEIAGIREIIANDLSKQAVESIQKNVAHNNVSHLITSNHANALHLMYMSTDVEKRFDVIDLDPYGCPSYFLCAALQSIADGGILLVTATDMAVLAGNAPESCFVKYGSVPLRMKSCHEMALRILLYCIETNANRYGRYIEPLLSISADFYVRVFVRVRISQAKCKLSVCKQSWIYQCTGCDTYTLHPLGITKPNPSKTNPNQVKFALQTGPPVNKNCEHCGNKHHLGGPIWTAPIHDVNFVENLLELIETESFKDLGTKRRIIGMLSVIEEELMDIPLYYTLDKLCSVLKLQTIPILKFRSALLHAGYRVSFSHAYKNSVKTDAPASVIWDILRCWCKIYPIKEERIQDNAIIKAILQKESEIEHIFEPIHCNANPNSRRNALTRYQANPTSFWGPGTRATIMIGSDKLPKKERNQNKKQKSKNKEDNSEDQLHITSKRPGVEISDEKQLTIKQLKVDE